MTFTSWLRVFLISGVTACPALSQYSYIDDYQWIIVKRSGVSLQPCRIDSIGESILHFRMLPSHETEIPLDSVDTIARQRESQFWIGAGVGFLFGAIVGGVIGYSSMDPNAEEVGAIGNAFAFGGGILVGSVSGFTAGGLIGAQVGADDELSLLELDKTIRTDSLKSWIRKVK
jgi:hypothetical protein